jgi:hypothetical protein
MRAALAIVASVVALAVAACGASYGEETKTRPKAPDAGPIADGGIPVSDAAPTGGRPDPTAYATTLCAHDERCFPLFPKRNFTSTADCVAKVAADATLWLSAAGVTITPAQLDACNQKLATQCIPIFNAVPECAFKGSFPEGTTCMYGSQCSTGDCFQATGYADCGFCRAPVAEGGNCQAAYCQVGLWCNDKFTCVKPLGEGAACDQSKQCADGLACVGAKCTKLLPNGAACQVALANCDYNVGLDCVPSRQGSATGTCTADPFAKLGQACGWDASKGTFTDCEASACTSSTAPGTCAAYGGVGAACNDETAFCIFGLACSSGHCKLPDATTCK